MRAPLRNAHRMCVTLVLVLLASPGCDGTQLFDPSLPQGVEGMALIGPQCPVQSQTNPCPDLPHEAWIEVLDADLDFVVRVRSESDGSFRIGLVPGDYVLSPVGGDPFPTVSPQDVVVQAGAYTEVVVRFDTGIR